VIFKPVRGTKLNTNHPLAKGLFACYLFQDATTNDLVWDYASKNNGTNENANAKHDIVATERGWAAELNGTQDYTRVAPNKELNTAILGNALSVVTWIKATDDALRCFWEIDTGNTQDYFNIRFIETDTLSIWFEADNTGEGFNISNVSQNEWHQVVLTMSGTLCSVYIDGHFKDSNTYSKNLSDLDLSPDINIGVEHGSTGSNRWYFEGFIESTLMWDRELQADEVLNLYYDPYQMMERKRILPVPTSVTDKIITRPANIKPTRGARLNREHPLVKGLVGLWLFNEGTGGKVFDYSGNEQHGSFNGLDETDWVVGEYGTCVRFVDGQSESINCAIPSEIADDISQGTVFVITKPIDRSANNNIVAKHDGSNAGWFFELVDNQGDFRFQLERSSTDLRVQTAGWNGVAEGEWVNLAAVWDINGANTDQKLYYGLANSSSLEEPSSYGHSQTAGSGSVESDATHPITIGNRSDDAPSWGEYDGDIAYVAIYNRVLTLSDLKLLALNPYEMFYAI
jgi:hypothetical protein